MKKWIAVFCTLCALGVSVPASAIDLIPAVSEKPGYLLFTIKGGYYNEQLVYVNAEAPAIQEVADAIDMINILTEQVALPWDLLQKTDGQTRSIDQWKFNQSVWLKELGEGRGNPFFYIQDTMVGDVSFFKLDRQAIIYTGVFTNANKRLQEGKPLKEKEAAKYTFFRKETLPGTCDVILYAAIGTFRVYCTAINASK